MQYKCIRIEKIIYKMFFIYILKRIILQHQIYSKYLSIQMPALIHENMLNQKMKEFSFVGILGQGAFAKVYQAIDQRDNSEIAIKAIPKQLMKETPKLQQLVKTQIKVLKTCKNQNIIRFIDSFTSAKTVFIAVEYCNGGDLQKYLENKKRLTEDQATNFLKQILNGFRGLHEVGAMHRDFKLANVLLHNGICKIADLGFAKQMEKKSLTTTILGTSLTMAPQVLDERPYGMEADLWSIGVVYYQMIYGKYPYTGLNDYDILKKIKNNRPDYSSIKISGECRDFIDKCLTVNPKARIKWAQVYQHPLLTKSQARFIYGTIKSKISLGSNKNYYAQEQKRFQKQQYFPNIDDILKKKDFLDVTWQDGGQIRQSVNVQKLMQQANMKKQKQLNFNNYQKKYINRRNNIMFIFKFVCPHANTLVKYKANHGIALFITSKKAYIDMKNLINDLKKINNIFKIERDWKQFTTSQIYAGIIKQFEGDLEMIQAQALSYQFDIQIQSKEIEAEKNIQHVSSKNWEGLVKDTVNEYWFLLAESLSNVKDNRDREVLVRVLQALDYYRDNKITDIEEFDKIMQSLIVGEAEKKIGKKMKSIFEFE